MRFGGEAAIEIFSTNLMCRVIDETKKNERESVYINQKKNGSEIGGGDGEHICCT